MCVPITFTLEMIFALFSRAKFIETANLFISNYRYLFLLFNFPLIQSRLNRGRLVYLFSLRFSGSKFLINLRRQFRVRKIFRTQLFAGFEVILCSNLMLQVALLPKLAH